MKTDRNGKTRLAGGLANRTPQSHQGNSQPLFWPKRLFTAKEAGIYLGFRSAWPVRELMWKGNLPYVQIGKRRIAFDVGDLDRFIESRKTLEHLH